MRSWFLWGMPQRNHDPNTALMGCPCHLMHNAASIAVTAYAKITGFNLNEQAIDLLLFYYFDHSSRRKYSLHEYCESNDIEYRHDRIKHNKICNNAWLGG